MNNKVIKIIVGLIILLLFNLLFFMWTGPERGDTTWLGYAFITLAYLWFGVTVAFPQNGVGKPYGQTLPLISGQYLVLTFILSLILMILGLNFTLSVTLEVVLFVAFLVRYVLHLQANISTAKDEEKRSSATLAVKNWAEDVNSLSEAVEDPSAKKALKHLYDTIRCSPINGNVASDQQKQAQVGGLMDCLYNAVNNRDWQNVGLMAKKLDFIFSNQRRMA